MMPGAHGYRGTALPGKVQCEQSSGGLQTPSAPPPPSILFCPTLLPVSG